MQSYMFTVKGFINITNINSFDIRVFSICGPREGNYHCLETCLMLLVGWSIKLLVHKVILVAKKLKLESVSSNTSN